MSGERQIISASRRTDIPAAYTDWFFERLRAGHCWYRNPFGGKLHRVSLRPENVIAFVFWSKWFAPLLRRLDELERTGYRSFFHFTITGYPRPLEARVPPLERAIPQLVELGRRAGAENVVWRYDPIVIADSMSASWHLERFARLADALAGSTTRVYISFVSMYKKTGRNLADWSRLTGSGLLRRDDAAALELTARMAALAAARCMKLHSCCDDSLAAAGAAKGHCIDAEAIRRLVGAPHLDLPAAPSREQCGCCRSRDIGAYDTCPLGCSDCYANASPEAGRQGFRRVDRHADILAPESVGGSQLDG